MQAFLNVADDVIATSTRSYTLEQAQSVRSDIVAVINDAPSGLVRKADASAAQPYYHRFDSGDGTLLAHYVEIEVLKPLKLARGAEIDARTEELIAAGFESSNGKRFRIDDSALTRYQAMFLIRNDPTVSYPIVISVYEDDGIVQGLPNANAVSLFVFEMLLGHLTIVDSGQDLKALITAATTKAAIDAIVDDR